MWDRVFVGLFVMVELLTMSSNLFAQSSSGASITYSVSSYSVVLHEPVFMTLSVINESNSPFHLDLGQDRKEALRFSVRAPNGGIITSLPRRHEGIAMVGDINLAPGEPFKQTVLLNEWVSFSEAGTYEIRVWLTQMQGGGDVPNSSMILTPLQVLPANSERLATICKELSSTIQTSASANERGEAAVALSYINDPIAIPYLLDLATQHFGSMARLASDGLARIGGTGAVNALISLGTNQNREIAAQARASLRQISRTTNDAALKEQIKLALEKAR